MKKGLAKCIKSVEGGVFEVRKIWLISLIIGFFNLQFGFAYEPGSISGKYQSECIDHGFCYSNWMKTTMKENYGSEDIVRQSICPSAMVDSDGILYTIDLYGMSSGNYGADFLLCKYSADEAKVSLLKSVHFYPWVNCGTSINLKDEPYLGIWGFYITDRSYCADRIHNSFQPNISQQIGTSSGYIAIWFYIPPLRYAYASTSNEGILYADFFKSDLSLSTKKIYSEKNPYCINRAPFLRYKNTYPYTPQFGNYSGWQYGSKVHLDFLATATETDHKCINWYQHNSSWETRASYKSVLTGEAWLQDGGFLGALVGHRYIFRNNYVYGILVRYGYYLLLMRTNVNTGKVVLKSYAPVSIWIETFQAGGTDSCYDYDFCLIEDEGDLFFCTTSLCAGGGYTAFTSSYNWTSTYCNWTINHSALVIRGFKLSEDDTYQAFEMSENHDYPQNVIYTTTLQRGYNAVIGIEKATNATAKEKCLYLNTHKICVYESDLGNKYLIYCYCYPGKSKQLYLGYAPVYFAKDSSDIKHVMLGTKIEFRENKNQWSNSFSNFTDCSRIISMDCRNGHLWITWMNADNSKYYYFHIQAKDLIIE